jgi:hypothetical protein
MITHEPKEKSILCTRIAASLCGSTKCHQCGAAVQIELHGLAILYVKIQSGIFVREWNFVWYAGLKIPLSIPL